MSDSPSHYFITTAIDYPNSRPHIGTAFEKIGADVQARFRRMEGESVHFLMGNDENTIKVPQKARELGVEPKRYVDEMAAQFQQVWRALDISYDEFIQTSEERHHRGCQKFIQAVYDAGDIYKGVYTGPLLQRLRSVQDRERGRRRPGALSPPPQHAADLARRGELLLPPFRLSPEAARPLRDSSRIHPAGKPAQRDRQPGRDRAQGRGHHPKGLYLGNQGPVRPGPDDLRLVRRACSITSRRSDMGATRSGFAGSGRPMCTSSARTSRGSTAHSGRPC